MSKRIPLLLAVMMLSALVAACQVTDQLPQPGNPGSAGNQPGNAPHTIGHRTKTSGCVVNGALPDAACTPGAILADATTDQICTPGYSKNVRNVSTQEKDQVYREYGIKSHTVGEYEVDHLISLELGGSNGIANLWPEAAEPRPGFHEKDKVENYLHDQVCNGKMSLQEAQYEIATDWMSVYNRMPGK